MRVQGKSRKMQLRTGKAAIGDSTDDDERA
jgi:hypothetical protein